VEAAVTSDDGTRQVRARASGDPAKALALGAGVAERLVDLGAMDLLPEIPGLRSAPQGTREGAQGAG
jgi:porphobilinogen deaminase